MSYRYPHSDEYEHLSRWSESCAVSTRPGLKSKAPGVGCRRRRRITVSRLVRESTVLETVMSIAMGAWAGLGKCVGGGSFLDCLYHPWHKDTMLVCKSNNSRCQRTVRLDLGQRRPAVLHDLGTHRISV